MKRCPSSVFLAFLLSIIIWCLLLACLLYIFLFSEHYSIDIAEEPTRFSSSPQYVFQSLFESNVSNSTFPLKSRHSESDDTNNTTNQHQVKRLSQGQSDQIDVSMVAPLPDFCRPLIGSSNLAVPTHHHPESAHIHHLPHQDRRVITGSVLKIPDYCSEEMYIYKQCGVATATKRFDQKSTMNGDIYWIMNFDLVDFVEETLPRIQHYFTLIYVTDLDIPSPIYWDADARNEGKYEHFFQQILENPFLLYIFLENYDGTLTKFVDEDTEKPLVSPLPIGLEFHGGIGNRRKQYLCYQQVVEHRLNAFNLDDRTLQIYVDSALQKRYSSYLSDWDSMFGRDWTPNMDYSTKWDSQSADLLRLYLVPDWERKYYFRHWAIWNIEENENVQRDLFFVDESRMTEYEALERRSEFVFSLSLFGTGMDCHRTWEAILASNIVIVIESPLDILYRRYDLPVVSIKSFEEITESRLREWYEEYGDKVYLKSAATREKMTNGFWRELIQGMTREKVQRLMATE